MPKAIASNVVSHRQKLPRISFSHTGQLQI